MSTTNFSIRLGQLQRHAVIILAVAITPVCVYSEELKLDFQSVQSEYVFREPIKFYVTLTNVSNQVVRVVDVKYYNNNMEHYFFEIKNPSGQVSYRKNQYLVKTQYINKYYRGEPIPPDYSIRSRLYPLVTHEIDPETVSIKSGAFSYTFKDPGIYKIRAIYYVPTYFKNLWKGAEGKLYSNEIEITVTAPTAAEKEILDAICFKGDLAIGDDHVLGKFDDAALRGVIDKYPGNKMTKYAKYFLAKSLTWGPPSHEPTATRAEHTEAVKIFEELRTADSGFRFEEVHICLAQAYVSIGDYTSAQQVANHALREEPYLKDDYQFMTMKMLAGNIPGKDMSKWISNRRAGKHLELQKEQN